MFDDGLILVFNEQKDVLKFNLEMVNEDANIVKRKLDNSHTVTLTNTVILKPGKKLTDGSVRERAGLWMVTALHFIYEIWLYTKDDNVVPEYMKNIWEEYNDHVRNFDIPEEK